jgi:hypothetical protein
MHDIAAAQALTERIDTEGTLEYQLLIASRNLRGHLEVDLVCACDTGRKADVGRDCQDRSDGYGVRQTSGGVLLESGGSDGAGYPLAGPL